MPRPERGQCPASGRQRRPRPVPPRRCWWPRVATRRAPELAPGRAPCGSLGARGFCVLRPIGGPGRAWPRPRPADVSPPAAEGPRQGREPGVTLGSRGARRPPQDLRRGRQRQGSRRRADPALPAGRMGPRARQGREPVSLGPGAQPCPRRGCRTPSPGLLSSKSGSFSARVCGDSSPESRASLRGRPQGPQPAALNPCCAAFVLVVVVFKDFTSLFGCQRGRDRERAPAGPQAEGEAGRLRGWPPPELTAQAPPTEPPRRP